MIDDKSMFPCPYLNQTKFDGLKCCAVLCEGKHADGENCFGTNYHEKWCLQSYLSGVECLKYPTHLTQQEGKE